MNAESINIRSIQHFMYCPHRWGLIEIERVWQENGWVVGANLLHNNVHSGKHKIKSSAKTSFSNVTVFSDRLNLYGVLDCIEFIPDENGIEIEGYSGKRKVVIIEYKPTAPKKADFKIEDAMQVYAQKVCVDELLNCNSEGFLYYADTKRRVKIPFDSYDFENELKSLLKKIREYTELKRFPKPEYGKKCSGCSLYEDCIPKVKPTLSVKEMLEEDISV